MKSLKANVNARQIFDLTVLNGSHRDIRRLRREAGNPTHHGNKVWKSSLVLMDYLSEFPLPAGSRVLDVGCGWGISGIFCARHFRSDVTALDIDASVFPFVNLHAEINGVALRTIRRSYERITVAMLQEYDVMVGGDICFWDHLATPLFNLARRAARANVRTIITDPGRPPFLDMAERCCEKLGGQLDAWSVPAPYNTSGYILDINPD